MTGYGLTIGPAVSDNLCLLLNFSFYLFKRIDKTFWIAMVSPCVVLFELIVDEPC